MKLKNVYLLQESNWKARVMRCNECDVMIYFMYSKAGINFVLEKSI